MSADWLIVFMWHWRSARCVRLGIYSEMRRRRFWPTHAEDRIFRCPNCGYVYTDDPDVDRSRCAQCGKLNEPIVF